MIQAVRRSSTCGRGMEGARESTEYSYQTCYLYLNGVKCLEWEFTLRGKLEVITDVIKGAYSRRLRILSG